MPENTKLEENQQSQTYVDVDDELLSDILDLIHARSENLLKNILNDLYPADIAHLINRIEIEDGDFLFNILSIEDASKVIIELDDAHREHFLETLSQKRITELVGEMQSDDATDIVGELPKEKAEGVLENLETEDYNELQELLQYGEYTAGGIMQKETVTVLKTDTVKKAISLIRKMAKETENIYTIYVLDENEILVGSIPVSKLILYSPNRRIYKVMNADVLSVPPLMDQEEVAQIFKKYDILSLPVVSQQHKLLGHIAIDDIVDVLEEEHKEDVAQLIGSDADEMESRSPVQIAMLRLPWVLLTLLIEFFAGVVVSQFDKTLSQVILLASFMPIISAISGNTGLQSAAIIVRGLATGHVNLKQWWVPLLRQIQTTLIIGSVCAFVIGIVGSLWDGNWVFGVVVGLSMFVSINISGIVGTSTPMISKRFGFDPAMTAGPFETAFQDVVGIAIFLSIATSLLNRL